MHHSSQAKFYYFLQCILQDWSWWRPQSASPEDLHSVDFTWQETLLIFTLEGAKVFEFLLYVWYPHHNPLNS